ncbi:Gp14 [uncultured Mycobacterium sp.]|uniref:Gp14 n=1 Tax=uncultured Mycobacterium sp. TaxID=171292 RepID=A0A1Y5P530_9MYCO|nr:Gp14 [uncultured Mycobacterium sp.]
MSDEQPEESRPMKPEEARAQEAEFFGVATGYDYDIGDGQTWTLPYPRYLPPKMRMRYLEHLRVVNEDLDQEQYDHPVTGKRSKRSVFPLRMKLAITKENPKGLIDEDEMLCVALMGQETYDRFLAAGGVPGQVQARWQLMNRQMEERLRRDPQFP